MTNRTDERTESVQFICWQTIKINSNEMIINIYLSRLRLKRHSFKSMNGKWGFSLLKTMSMHCMISTKPNSNDEIHIWIESIDHRNNGVLISLFLPCFSHANFPLNIAYKIDQFMVDIRPSFIPLSKWQIYMKLRFGKWYDQINRLAHTQFIQLIRNRTTKTMNNVTDTYIEGEQQ